MNEEELYPLLNKLNQIDRVLEKPLKTLIDIAIKELQSPTKGAMKNIVKIPIYFPAFISLDRQSPPPNYNESTALCCATLQHLWRIRRRFPSLDKLLKKLKQELQRKNPTSDVVGLLADAVLLRGKNLKANNYINFIKKSSIMGETHPFLASLVFWVLLNAGEGRAHSGLGFLCFFDILWSLRRIFPGNSPGARIGPLPANAYVTAKCISPIQFLIRTLRERARLLERIQESIQNLQKLMREPVVQQRQSMPFLLDKLVLQLNDLAEYSISAEPLRMCAKAIEELAADANIRDTPTKDRWTIALKDISKALRAVGKEATRVLKEAAPLLEVLQRICKAVKQRNSEMLRKSFGVIVKDPVFTSKELNRKFWQDHQQASRKALLEATKAYDDLKNISVWYSGTKPTSKSISFVLSRVLKANRLLADSFEKAIADAVEWSDGVITREIANVSAGQWTEFDPAELVSGLAVVVTSGKIDNSQRIQDAATHALEGLRKDGSWFAGQPFNMDEELALGEWAPTADFVRMLLSSIAKFPEVQAADNALSQFVDWLESSRKQIILTGSDRAPTNKPFVISGWVSERSIKPSRVDLWATTYAINALLEARELVEFRLWQLCKRRFTVIESDKRLDQIEAVDLGAKHERRLHRRLSTVASETAGDDFNNSEYSMVLHGPPGSSKTVLAQAFSVEMWRRHLTNEPKLLRITPADFTRKGEERLDFEARMIFDLLAHIRGVTILFDEIDDLLKERKTSETSFLNLVIPAMLNRLQDLRDFCPRQEVCFLLATNYIYRIEPALIRKGRIDRALPVVYPDRDSRRSMFYGHAQKLKKPLKWAAVCFEKELRERIADTDYWPWMSVQNLCNDIRAAFLKKFTATKAKKEAKMIIDQHIKKYAVSIMRKSPYVSCIDDISRCPELRNEYLYYTLSGFDKPDDFIQKVEDEVESKLGTFADASKRRQFLREIWDDYRGK